MRHIDMYLDVVQKKKNAGGGGTGGITPSGTKVIKTNGKHDVTNFATADVQVPIPEAPTGKKVIEVTKNGVSTHDVAAFAQAEVSVAVPIPAEPSGTKTITENGTHDVKAFASVNVNVQSVGGVPQEKYNQLLSVVNGKVRETNFVNEDMTAIKDYLFQNNTVTVSYTFENVKTVGKYAFANSEILMSQTKMAALHLPIAASLGEGCFQNCMRLEKLDTPNVTTLYGPNIFSRCNFLERIVMPKLATYNLQSFRNQYKPPVKLLDILGGRQELDLSELTSLQTIVIRKTDAVVPLYSIVSTSVQSIYVEDTLVEQYKVATNWVNYADKIKPLSTYKEV